MEMAVHNSFHARREMLTKLANRECVVRVSSYGKVLTAMKARTVDFEPVPKRKINQIVTKIAAAEPDVVSLLEQINTSPGTWYAAIDLANAFFSVPVHKDHQKQFAFSWQGQQYTFTVLPQGYINSPALCHNLVRRDLDRWIFHKISHWCTILMTLC